MIHIGEYNQLKIIKKANFGVYLGNGEVEILMPAKWVPEGAQIGDELNVFVYRDSDDRLIATTLTPLATANTFAFLEVKQTNDTGAFLDLGMEKDLLVPFREQQHRMYPDNSYVVYVYVDEKTNRLIASSKLKKFIQHDHIELEEKQEVDLLIYSETNLGLNAIINNRYSGLIYKNELYENIRIGDRLKGYVKTSREDNKIDLSLQKTGVELVEDVRERILEELKKNKGYLPYGDNSSPEEVQLKFRTSKKAFKKAIGGLFKEKLISISEKGIALIK